MNYFPITAEGVRQFQAEIAALKVKRPAYIARLAAAAALGDRSENAEYSAAKRDLRQLEGRLRYLDRLLRYGQVASPPTGQTAELGCTLQVAFAPDDVADYHLVGPKEGGLGEDYLACDSPLGAAVWHQAAGTTVTVQAPAGAYPVTLVAVSA